jgi:hypothetical protein
MKRSFSLRRFPAVLAASVVALVASASTAGAQSSPTVFAWGYNSSGQCNVPTPPLGLYYVQVSAGTDHTLALRSDGSAEGWGSNNFNKSVVPALPAGLRYAQVAAGGEHSVALRSDGSIVAWGRNSEGQCNVPALPSGISYVEVAAGSYHTLARRSDGSIVAWGLNNSGQCNVPALPSFLVYVSVAAGGWHSVARVSSGDISAWGENSYGECNVPALPPGASYTSVAAGGFHTVACRSDGSVIAWGRNTDGQCSPVPSLPTGVSYVHVGAGFYHTLATRTDGEAVGWGQNFNGQIAVPSVPLGFVFDGVDGGEYYSVGCIKPLPCGGAKAYCTPAAPNSVSAAGATFSVQGCASHGVNNLVFNVINLPHNTPGIFFYGPLQTKVPFGNGWICVAGPATRVLPSLTATASGTITYNVDLTKFPFSSGSGQILPGSNWNFQYWYRDPIAPPKGYNLSNAVQVVFAP